MFQEWSVSIWSGHGLTYSRYTEFALPLRDVASRPARRFRHIFNGNSNWNQFYDWPGPHHAISLHTFRVDSPMKGAVSSSDETKLSFHVAAISPSGLMTVREYLWNADPQRGEVSVRWGTARTIVLRPSRSTN